MSSSSSSSAAFNITVNNASIPVTLAADTDLSHSELTSFPAFKTWSSTLARALAQQHTSSTHSFRADPYALRSIAVQAVDRFGKGQRLGFVKLRAELTNGAGEGLPGSVFLRGGSVGMLVVLQPDDVPAGGDTDKFALLTVQPRVPAGSLGLVELPAGMIDDSGSFAGAAAKEIKEELGLDIPEDKLIDMTRLVMGDEDGEGLQRAVYTSPGGSDEFCPLFLHQRRVPRASLDEWEGKLTGLRSEGEKITLKLVRLEDLWREGARDAKALSAWALYEGLRREGKLPAVE